MRGFSPFKDIDQNINKSYDRISSIEQGINPNNPRDYTGEEKAEINSLRSNIEDLQERQYKKTVR